MGLSRLAEKCRKCPFVSKCQKKQKSYYKNVDDLHQHMEAVAFLSEAGQSGALSATTPILRATIEIHVDGKTLAEYKDDIEKQLYGPLYEGLGLQFGG